MVRDGINKTHSMKTNVVFRWPRRMLVGTVHQVLDPVRHLLVLTPEPVDDGVDPIVVLLEQNISAREKQIRRAKMTPNKNAGIT